MFATLQQWPKTAEIDQGWEAKGCELPPPAATVGQCRQQFKAGFKLLHVAKQTSQHPPSPNLCVSKIGTVMCDRERKTSRKRQLNFGNHKERKDTQRRFSAQDLCVSLWFQIFAAASACEACGALPFVCRPEGAHPARCCRN